LDAKTNSHLRGCLLSGFQPLAPPQKKEYKEKIYTEV
jgi:hypothetical protein